MLTENDVIKCLNAAGCFGNVKMTFESGPYCIDRPTINASRFAEAIESASTAPLLAEIERLKAENADLVRLCKDWSIAFRQASNAQPSQEETPHLWDGSPMPNYRVTREENTEAQRAGTGPTDAQS